jgi:hypothetical protein
METKPYHERITDSKFRSAVDLLDAGDAAGLSLYLSQKSGTGASKDFI